MEPWEEALDLDDSDIPSLLRPCKRHHRHQTSISTATTTNSWPFLKPCSSQPSQSLINQEETQQQQEEKQQEQQHSRPNSLERRRTIPGPAGAVQSAMLQRSRDRENEQENIIPISTQEYIRRAVKNAPEFDHDFSTESWLSALKFIGTVDGVVPSVPLNAINQCANDGRIDQVVAVIKSCTQSSLGGLMLTLKDPTGTIGASVHQKVLSESQFAKDFCIGSVLILQKVAIFSPSKTVHYLNIMPRNLLKVFNKVNVPLTEQNPVAYSVKYVAPGEECLGKVGSPHNTFTLGNRTSGEMMDGMLQNINGRGSLDVNDQLDSGNLLPESITCSSRSVLKGNLVNKEPFTQRQDAAEGLFAEAVPDKTRYNEQGFSLDNDGRLKVAKERLQDDDAAKSLMMNHVQGTQEDNRVQKQRQQLVTAALPQWTDEQLEELFAGQDDDDGSFL